MDHHALRINTITLVLVVAVIHHARTKMFSAQIIFQPRCYNAEMCAQELRAARAERFFPPASFVASVRGGQRAQRQARLFVCSRAHPSCGCLLVLLFAVT